MKEYDSVKLLKDFDGIRLGTRGAIVSDYTEAFDVEFFDTDGDTIDVVTVPAELLELVHSFDRKRGY
ncbi:DUF4926 domain-containing protein [Alloscardovia macacae]|uniref:Ribosomal protein L1 family protein n=1 Tax=Alloscardovia macacae TaxID=1160091 RepID=A0A261F7E2_9BIFI|nr:DUF4926 domain-containing protein [Alloscardovia macacae]OZG55004.1 ribosomal protein L1 family protein [Alloscardovia macacae]